MKMIKELLLMLLNSLTNVNILKVKNFRMRSCNCLLRRVEICAGDNRRTEMTPIGWQRGLIPQRVQNGRDTGTIFEY